MLPVSRLINVQTQITKAGAQGRLFNQALAIGDSNVISGLQRIRDYSSLAEVIADFGLSAPETLAATTYFDQKPTPTSFACGRWIRTASAAILQGAILSASQSAIGLFNQITNGGIDVVIDGTARNLTGLNFSVLANLNAVAAAVTTALSSHGTCTWNGAQFLITSATTGVGVDASGTLTVSTNPSNGDTVTINGTVVTFVSALTSGVQVLIGTDNTATAVNLWAVLTNSTNANLIACTYSVAGHVVTVTAAAAGTAGNAIALLTSSANVVVSAATLAGGVNASTVAYATTGAGQDISTLMGLTAALALPLMPGYAAETPLAAVVACDSVSRDWYGMGFAASVQPTDDDACAIGAFIEAAPVTRMYGVTTSNTNALTKQVSSDIASRFVALAFDQSFTQYSSTNPYAAFAVFGGLLTTNLTGSATFKTMMYKTAVNVIAEDLTTPQADALQFKRCNVYVQYDNDTSIIQYGTMAGSVFIDETYGSNALADAIQNADYNVLYTTTTKVPQTDQGDQQFVVAMSQVCQQFVTNGFGAPGQWNATGFGQLVKGQFLKLGYYIFMQPLAQQSEEDRAARKVPPFQIAFKLAGANQTAQILITVNQ